MRASELLVAGPGAQLRAMDDGTVTATELVREVLARVVRTDRSVGAFVRFDEAAARAAAAAADEARAGGVRSGLARPLLGVPVAVKDDTDIAGDVTGFGSRAFTEVACQDAEVVRRLRRAGAVLVGKTTLSELGIYGFTESAATGATRNPWDRWRTPGGSSGGSAAAVAAGVVGLATASDGSGSIRVPAACCGLVGFKPTAGTMPSSGSWYGLSEQGALTRRVEDTARYLDAVGDLPESMLAAAARQPGRLRIGLDLSPLRAVVPRGLDPQVRAAVLATGRLLAGLGHDVWRVRTPQGVAPQAFTARYLAGIHESAQPAQRPELLEPRTEQVVRLGAAVRPGLLSRAVESGPAHGDRAMATVGADVLLTPVLAGEPPEIGHWGTGNGVAIVVSMGRFYAYTPMWNHTGQPAVSMPAGFSRAGLPLSVQLVARRGDDGRLMSLAAQLEDARPWYDRVPEPAPGGRPSMPRLLTSRYIGRDCRPEVCHVAATWDPATYLGFADERVRPFADLLARVAVVPTSITDLGCGPGHLSALLRSRWPGATVEGIDASEQMIERAVADNADAGVSYRRADLRRWRPSGLVDLLVSNATLQWVPGHLDLLAALAERVAPLGCFAFSVPGNFDAPSHLLLRELAGREPYARHTRGVEQPAGHDAATYLAVLARPGWRVDAWETTYLHLLHGPDPVLRWVSGTAARPVLDALPEELKRRFAADYGAALREAYPAQPHGTVLPFRRVFCVAHRVPG